jgi:hypothetical protein
MSRDDDVEKFKFGLGERRSINGRDRRDERSSAKGR